MENLVPWILDWWVFFQQLELDILKTLGQHVLALHTFPTSLRPPPKSTSPILASCCSKLFDDTTQLRDNWRNDHRTLEATYCPTVRWQISHMKFRRLDQFERLVVTNCFCSRLSRWVSTGNRCISRRSWATDPRDTRKVGLGCGDVISYPKQNEHRNKSTLGIIWSFDSIFVSFSLSVFVTWNNLDNVYKIRSSRTIWE